MNFMFWNIQKKDSIFSTIFKIVKEEDIDVLSLAEFPKGDDCVIGKFVADLQLVFDDFLYLKPTGKREKVLVFYRNNSVNMNNKFDGEYVHAKEIISGVRAFSIIFCHLKSLFGTQKEELVANATSFCQEIKNFEDSIAKHKNTIICGDFNMSPFDCGMVSAQNFNATMDINIANMKTRDIHKKDYELFYNPMWNLLGDNAAGRTPGSYYLNKKEFTNQFWFILDQVIMRPSIIPLFDIKGLQILTQGKTYDLLDTNKKISSKFSDHLPLKFKVNI